jgi:hypothetical protein
LCPYFGGLVIAPCDADETSAAYFAKHSRRITRLRRLPLLHALTIPRDKAIRSPYTWVEGNSMTHKVKDLSPNQRLAIESLLGRSIAENEEISILTSNLPSTPGWLQESWKSAKEQGLDELSVEEIEAEIAAARKARRENRPSNQ